MNKLFAILLILMISCTQSFESEGTIIDLKKNCDSLNGNFCERNQYCDGQALDELCCKGNCYDSKVHFNYDTDFKEENGCFVPNNKCNDGHCKVLAFVDEEVNEKLSEELSIWKQDIHDDLNAEVEFLTYPSNVVPYQIKSDLAKKSEEDIMGIIFVGDLPTMFYGGGYMGEVYPSDYYYLDWEGHCSDEYKKSTEQEYSENYVPLYVENKPYFYEGKCQEPSQVFLKPFWRGRLNPRVDKIERLKNYFERNHAYRTGKLSYDKKFLAYTPIVQSDYQNEGVDFQLSSLYSEDEILLVPNIEKPEVEEIQGVEVERLDPSAKMYLNELSKPYEFVEYDGHGLVLSHQSSINNDDITKAMPQAMFYELNSCSVGRFTVDNYIGGEYLFSGKGLVAFAATTPVYGGAPQITKSDAEMYTNGLIFGEIYDLTIHNQPAHILGDPTLKMRNLDSNAKICFNETIVDFGSLEKDETSIRELKVTNIGTDKLVFDFEDKKFPYTTDSNFIFNYDCKGELMPGESKNCFFRANAIKKGVYSGVLNFVSNDPDNNLVKIGYVGVQT